MLHLRKVWRRQALIAPLQPVLAASLLAGCAATGPLPGHARHSPEQLILNPGPTVAESAETQPLDSDSILAVTPEMQAFVTRHVNSERPGFVRLQQLLDGMLEEGLLALDYQADDTATAEQTFRRRKGNCLSFTNLFVALARTAGLEVRFQLVEVPPNWLRDGRWVIRDSHINTLVSGSLRRGSLQRDYVVDFNIADFQSHYPRREIDDDQAFALYYLNRATELMREHRDSAALAHFHAAYRLAPQTPALWANLGSWFRLRGDHARAQSAYLEALRLRPNDPVALSSLSLLYESMGRPQWARRVEDRLMALREQNPYYFYQRSQAAYFQGEWMQAQAWLDKAVKRLPQEHQFHLLRAQIAYQMGQLALARSALNEAMKLSQDTHSRQRYSAKLDWLRRQQQAQPENPS